MEAMLENFGYAGLFAVSFLAATLVPLGSEAAAVFMALAGFNPGCILAVASTGNVLGAVVNYFAGKWGRKFLPSKWLEQDEAGLAKAEKAFGKWGSPALFFAWLPVVGDPLTFVAGVLRVNILVFLFWTAFGKILRYWIIIKGAGG